MRRRFLLGVATAAPALLMACSTPSATVARYDLGLPPPPSTAAATDPQLATVLTLADVSAPAWLDSPAEPSWEKDGRGRQAGRGYAECLVHMV